VPDLRTTSRPRAPSFASTVLIVVFTVSVSSGFTEPEKRTFFSTCGAGAKTRSASLAFLPSWVSTESTCRAATSPSPVVA